MARRKPRSPGVMLRGRAAGLHYWDDEVTADGGKIRLRRERAAFQQSLLTEYGITTG